MIEILTFFYQKPMDSDRGPHSPKHRNAFGLIGISSSLDLSGFFEKEAFEEQYAVIIHSFNLFGCSRRSCIFLLIRLIKTHHKRFVLVYPHLLRRAYNDL